MNGLPVTFERLWVTMAIKGRSANKSRTCAEIHYGPEQKKLHREVVYITAANKFTPSKEHLATHDRDIHCDPTGTLGVTPPPATLRCTRTSSRRSWNVRFEAFSESPV